MPSAKPNTAPTAIAAPMLTARVYGDARSDRPTTTDARRGRAPVGKAGVAGVEAYTREGFASSF